MKKLLALLLTVLMIPVTPVFAKDTVATLPVFDVTFNSVKVENINRQFPLIVYKDITYVPMTYYDCRYLGLTTRWDSETNTLSIEKSDVTCAYRDYKWEWENDKKCQAAVCSFNIVVNGKEIDNSKEEYPLLTFRDVTYFPLTWRFAVDEFGWEYSFDSETGLVIVSDNHHAEVLNLPYLNGGAATDGEYYYYNGDKDGKLVVYRVPVSDTSSPEIISDESNFENRPVSFIEEEGSIYFRRVVGSTPIMQRNMYYKILPDGSCVQENPKTYYYHSHGYSEFGVGNDNIIVKGVHPYFDSATNFSYEKDGITTEVEPLPGRVRIGQKRNENTYVPNTPVQDCIKIWRDKIYFVAAELNEGTNSALYCIDTNTGVANKIIDDVCGFYVYTGWVDSLRQNSTMILYDNGGTLMRYTEATGETSVIEHSGGEGLILVSATGKQEIFAAMKTRSGDRTLVQSFDDYASGSGSRTGVTWLDTTTGTYAEKYSDYLCVYTSGEADGEEVRLFVTDGSTDCYKSSDALMVTNAFTNNIFVYENTLLYSIDANTIVKVNLKQ